MFKAAPSFLLIDKNHFYDDGQGPTYMLLIGLDATESFFTPVNPLRGKLG